MSERRYKVVFLCSDEISSLGKSICEFFDTSIAHTTETAIARAEEEEVHAVVVDSMGFGGIDMALCAPMLCNDYVKALPVIVISQGHSLKDKLRAYDAGCDDILEGDTSVDEACARVTKSIFHRIANNQLTNRLEQANKTARTAILGNSELGLNIQFLLAVHNCDNLDQLGQQFFAIAERYSLRCSLQIRSAMGVKNMEAHGMAKDLESQLLTQMCESGRYIDFGSRTICNYGCISLLIKNMPVEDKDKYGSIKDNIFSLVQGMNARVIALEDKYRLSKEAESLKRLSEDVSSIIYTIKRAYQDVMKAIVLEVEQCSELLLDRVPYLALTEKDEIFLEGIAQRVIRETNATFRDGLLVDESLQNLEDSVHRALKNMELAEQQSIRKTDECQSESVNGIELF